MDKEPMKPYSAKVWDTLVEALHVYWQVVKEKWLSILAVVVPIQLLMALYRYSVLSRGAESLDNMKFENFVAVALGLTLGLVPVAIVVDRAFQKCTGHGRPSGGGIAAAWGRMMATWWFRMFSQIAIVAGPVVVLAIVLSARSIPCGGPMPVFPAIVVFLIIASVVAASVLIAVRWSFAVVMSAIHPVAGSAALGESWRFVSARASRCFFLLVAAFLVVSGISAVPSSFATWYARGGLLGLPSPSGTLLARVAAMFFGDICVGFGGLFLPVAMTTFWVRTVEPRELSESVRRGPARLLVSVLLALGAVAYAGGFFVGVRASIRAREAKAAELPSKSKALESLRREPAVRPLPDAYKEEHMEMENGELVVDSPFDLCIGSAEAAKLLGAKQNSALKTGHRCFAGARLSKPYFGCRRLILSFSGEEEVLGDIQLSSDSLPLEDCRKNVFGIAEDMGRRFGVQVETVLDITAEVALRRAERRGGRSRSSQRESSFCCEFLACQARLDNGGEIVRYRVSGMVDSKTREFSVMLSIRAEN